MTDMSLVLRLQAEAAQAKAELRAVMTEVKAVGTSGKTAGADAKVLETALVGAGTKGAAAAKSAGAAVKVLSGDLDVAKKAALAAAAAQDAVDGSVRRVGLTAGQSAAGVGNLAANFNDVAMMIMAGQSPMQLAIQQGTQITQVFGSGGATGAMGMMRAAVLQMLSPFNLATYAVIGFGAAAIQWLFETEEAGKSLSDTVSEMTSKIDAYEKSSALANSTQSELNEKFGQGADEARRYYEVLADLDRREAERATQAAAARVREEVAPTSFLKSDQRNAADFFDVSIWARDGQRAINPLLQAFDAVDKAVGIENQVQALRDLKAAFEVAAQASGGYSVAEEAALSQITLQLVEQERLLGLIRQQRADSANNNGRAPGFDDGLAAAMQMEMQRRAEVEKTEAALARVHQLYGQSRAESDAALATAREMLASTSEQAAMQAIIAKYGEESYQAVAARFSAEREVYAALVDSLGVSEAMAEQLLDSWDAANGIASANIAGMISAALGPAAALAARLWDAAAAASAAQSAQNQLDQMKMEFSPGGQAMIKYGGRTAGGTVSQNALATRNTPRPVRGSSGGGRGGGGGGGGGGPDRESFEGLQKAAKDALAALDLAIAQINEKVSLGLMSTAEATDAIAQAKERAAGNVADLIPKLETLAVTAGPKGAEAVKLWREQVKGLVVDLKGAGTELGKTLSDGFKSPFADFIKGAASGKEAFNDFGDFVIDKLADMAAQKFTDSIITPLFDGLFSGGGGLGSILGSIFPSAKGNVIPFAKGGIGAYSNSVVDKPTLFAMGGGQTGLMGEEDAEAIMPLGGGGVLALFGGREMRLPLERGAGGRLGVRVPNLMTAADRPPMAFARGGVVGSGSSSGTPAAMPGAPAAAGGNVIINIENSVPEVRVRTEEREEGGNRVTRVLIEQIDAALAEKHAKGDSAFGGVMGRSYGMQRTGR